MTEQEREQVLRMIENGTISPEDGLKLMRTLDQNPTEEDPTTRTVEAGAKQPPDTSTGSESKAGAETDETKAKPHAEQSRFETDSRIARIKSTARRLWQIPLWIGVFITLLGAWGMYILVNASRLNFWFYCLDMPLFLLGVLVILVSVGSRKARWIFVDVHQKPGERPARIFLGFPLPLKFAAGFMRVMTQLFPGLARQINEEKDGPGVDGMIKILELADTGITGEQPLVVNVDEGDDGERVQVYIG
jgi:hypothetical protein